MYLVKFKEVSKAVQLVSLSKLRKLGFKLKARDFTLSIAFELFKPTLEKLYRTTMLVFTSERSNCGKINTEVLSSAKEDIATNFEMNIPTRIVTVGWKGKKSLFSKYRIFFTANISEFLCASFLLSYIVATSVFETKFEKCVVFFSRYYKIFRQVATSLIFVSFALFIDFFFFFRTENVFYTLLACYSCLEMYSLYIYNINSILLVSFDETMYSELGCRAFSMEMAYKSALELISENMLIYNKARQEGITTDLLEVVSGAIYTVECTDL